MEKLCKMARRIDIALKALQILLIACTVLFGSIYIFGTLSGNYGTLSLRIDSADIAVSAPLGWLLFLVSEGVALYGLHIFRRILRPMKEGQPFAESVSADMRRLGWLVLIAGGVLSVVIGQLSRQIITTPNDTFVVETHQIDLSFLAVSAILFLFSYIFRYGEELQRLSDETL